MTTLSSRTRPARLALAVPLSLAALALAACGSDAPTTDTVSDPAPSSPAATESTSEPTSEPSPAEPRLIDFEDADSVGTKVTGPADATSLEGAPASFQDFVGRTAQRVAEESTCPDVEVGVTVDRLRTDGFAVGSVNDCEGHIALWADVDGTWTEIQSTLDLWSCGVLEKHAVPTDIAGDVCFDRTTREQRDYEQA